MVSNLIKKTTPLKKKYRKILYKNNVFAQKQGDTTEKVSKCSKKEGFTIQLLAYLALGSSLINKKQSKFNRIQGFSIQILAQ